MLTIVTTPRPFRGHTGVIQRNAIRSWACLVPRPEIILIDDVEGAAEIARECGLRHIQTVERNTFGTPLVRSIISTAQSAATHPVVCYVNADIILLGSVIESVRRIQVLIPGDFLLVARRWDCDIREPLKFDDPSWEQKFLACVVADAYRESAAAIDCFIFRKHTAWDIPPFAIGRSAWDGWFIHNALSTNVPVIDGSQIFVAFHQHHDYAHLEENGRHVLSNEECTVNQRLRGSFGKQGTIADSTYLLSEKGLSRRPVINRVVAAWLRTRMRMTYYIRGPLYPYSYPLLILWRTATLLQRRAAQLLTERRPTRRLRRTRDLK